MRASEVRFGPPAAPSQYTGRIVGLDGSHVLVSVRDAAGRSLSLDLRLQIDRVTGHVGGSLQLPAERGLGGHGGMSDAAFQRREPGPRLLAGAPQAEFPATLEEHVACYGRLPDLDPRVILAAVDDSGLLGRGGGGFPTGAKLAAVRAQKGRRVVVANGVEGEPLSLKDKALLRNAAPSRARRHRVGGRGGGGPRSDPRDRRIGAGRADRRRARRSESGVGWGSTGWMSSSRRHRTGSSSARRPRSWHGSPASRRSRRSLLPGRPSAACGAARRSSRTSRPWRTSRSSGASGRAGSARSARPPSRGRR